LAKTAELSRISLEKATCALCSYRNGWEIFLPQFSLVREAKTDLEPHQTALPIWEVEVHFRLLRSEVGTRAALH
jgi:hypothetical protein